MKTEKLFIFALIIFTTAFSLFAENTISNGILTIADGVKSIPAKSYLMGIEKK